MTISSLKSAIAVMKKHNSLLQKDQVSSMRHIAVLISYTMHRKADRIQFGVKQHKAIESLMQGKYTQGAPSGEIFGILENMLEDFQKNNAQAEEDEQTSQKNYNEMKDAKTAEMNEINSSKNDKSKQLGDAKLGEANDTEELELTRETLASDRSFLEDMVSRCDANAKNFDKRTADRADEVNAVSKAIEVLSSDAATANFEKTVPKSAPPAFIQLEQQQSRALRERAARVVEKSGNPVLSALAMHIRLDSFVKVKESIQALIDELKVQQKNEVDKRDFCNSEIYKTTKDTKDTTRDRDDKDTEIANFNAQIEKLTSEIAALTSTINDTAKEMKEAGQNRERDNNEYQTLIADHRNTQALIEKAIKFLAAVYEKFLQEKAMLIGTKAVASKFAGVQQPAPADFAPTEKKQSGANAVLQLLRKELNISKRTEAETHDAETKDQADYESFVIESNDSIDSMEKSRTQKNGNLAETKQKNSDAEIANTGLANDLETLANTLNALHQSCDFTLNNFDTLQEARAQESESLRQAKEILSGSNFGSFLQRRE